ncbi:unannotated protein [freshwater metagenome]|uniref:Unannotated protein n=1 Tax=freshwater metagenome TaxID=449393 RepID=A0A6J7KD75_9ZZZZ
MLVAAVIGSGIMAQRLSPDDVGLQLLENTIATAGALVAIILAFGHVSGAHLNPVVTIVDRIFGGLKSTKEAVGYVIAQIVGGVLGAIIANLMFGLDAVNLSTHVRSGGGIWLGEIMATFGLLMIVFGVATSGRHVMAPFAVAGYITAAYFATSSTSFANPAVTIARTLSDSFAGIAPESAPGFVIAQIVGGAVGALAVFLVFMDSRKAESEDA